MSPGERGISTLAGIQSCPLVFETSTCPCTDRTRIRASATLFCSAAWTCVQTNESPSKNKPNTRPIQVVGWTLLFNFNRCCIKFLIMRIGFIGAENAPILNNDNHETFLFRLTFLVYAVCYSVHAAKGSFHESSSIPAFPKIRTSELGYLSAKFAGFFSSSPVVEKMF